MVEIGFGILRSQALKRASFAGVDLLVEAIHRFLRAWKEDGKPFVWVKKPAQILAKAVPPLDRSRSSHCKRAKIVDNASR